MRYGLIYDQRGETAESDFEHCRLQRQLNYLTFGAESIFEGVNTAPKTDSSWRSIFNIDTSDNCKGIYNVNNNEIC